MPKNTSESYLLTESIDEYKERKQEEVVLLLELARNLGKIDEVSHKRFLLETCDETDWPELCDHYLRLWGDIVQTLVEHEERSILDRIVKGSEMIDNEPDPDKRRHYVKVYEALLEKLEEIRRNGGHPA